MRGRHRSRPPASVLAEIRRFVAEGVKEINLISQDTTYYGMDLWTAKAGPRQPVDSSRGPTLAALLREIEKIEGDFWVRLLYTHPAHWSDELIETIAQGRKVARYIDMPLQHIDEAMLGRMRRETSRAHIEDLIVRLRTGIPGIALRTTFIVGFPGETEAEFESLLEFIRTDSFRAARDFQILAGGRFARRENARTDFRGAKKRALPAGHDAATKNRARNCGGKSRTRIETAGRSAVHCAHRGGRAGSGYAGHSGGSGAGRRIR